MQKNLFTIEKDIDVEVSKIQLEENWMQKLWGWADENEIGDLEWCKEKACWRGLPRDKKRLLHFTTLAIHHADLDTLPQEIGNLKNLTKIEIKLSNLSEIPDTIGELENLTVLDLAFNNLTSLPKEIGKLHNLKILKLAHNRLTKLPDTMSTLSNLEVLDLSLNNQVKPPESLGKLNKLTQLLLSIIDILEIHKIGKNLPDEKEEKHQTILIKIKEFTRDTEEASIKKSILLEEKLSVEIDDLSMQQLRDWADENNISNEDFPRDKNELLILQELDLGGDDLECECLNDIPKEIGLLSSLTSLSFCIDGNDIPTLPESIGNLTNLHTLIISVCGSSYKDGLYLPKAVANLNKLKLIGLTGNISTDSIELLLKKCESLERLSIDNNQILKTLPKNICDCSSIKELVLINNRNLLLTPKQFAWAENLRDDEEGYDRVYCTKLLDGTSVSNTTDNGQKFQFYCIIPFDRSIKISEPNFASKEELF